MAAEPTGREIALATLIAQEVIDSRLGRSVTLKIARRLAGYRAELARQKDTEVAAHLDRLSPRERELVERLRAGVRLNAIAKECSISAHTIRHHMKRVFRKLEVHSQVELLSLVGGNRV